MNLPKRVTIMDVSPRDGLQAFPAFVPTQKKIELITKLIAAGVCHIEATSFVSPKWVPQMADAEQVLAAVGNRAGVTIEVLVANEKGYDRTRATGLLKEAGFVVAATESLNQKNVGMSIAGSMLQFAAIADKAKADGVQVRGTIAVSFICPYEGRVPLEQSLKLADEYFRLGADEVCLGDTVGRATPDHVYELFSRIKDRWPDKPLAGHFHDTHGHALANIFAAMQAGVDIFDSAVGNLGGCQFAKGATGNVSTERVVYLLDGMGIKTGIDYAKIVEAGRWAKGLVAAQATGVVTS
ncbi:MAG: hydroxymethylglutaryl-CoA lyase [Acidobacteriota bacterium]